MRSPALIFGVFCLSLVALSPGQSAAPAPPPILRDLSPEQVAQAERWLAGMSLRQKIAQLLIVNFYGYSPHIGSEEELRFRELVEDAGVGGLIILNRVMEGSVRRAQPYEMAAFLNRMQNYAKVPLLVAGDFERGPSMRLDGATLFPHAMAFGASQDATLTRRFGEAAACEARAVGVHWILAPSADVNSDPGNPVIHLRSFGQEPSEVSAHVTAFVRGVQENARCPLFATVKHFPGHGDTNVDSHFGLPRINRTREELDLVEIPPFKAAIEAGVASVMPGHLSVPALDESGTPASVSKKIVTDFLRGELGFGGFVSTDGLDMEGISRLFGAGEISVRVIEAGADVLVIPPQPQTSIDAIEAAVRSGRLTEERITESTRRVLLAKAKLNLQEERLVDLENIASELPSPQNTALALDVARKAVTALRNERQTLPLKKGARNCAVVLNRSEFTGDGRMFARTFRKLDSKARVWFVNESWSAAAIGQLRRELDGCSTVSVASFVSIGGFKGDSIPLPANQVPLAKALEKSRTRMVVIGFTNPYLASYFPIASAAVVPFSNVPTSEQATAEALFGEFPMTGRSPVTIPGVVEADSATR